MGNNVTVILSMTTVPWRMAHTLGVVKKLLRVPSYDYLVVNIPRHYEKGWPVDENLVKQFPKGGRLILNRTPDYGPATKFLPTLDLWPPQKEAILVVMDDSEYYPKFIKKIIKNQIENKNMAHTFYAYNYKGLTVPQGVDLISFWWPSLKDLREYWQKYGTQCWRVDDLILAGYLQEKGIPIKVLSRENYKWVWKPLPREIEGPTLDGNGRGESMDICFNSI